MNANLPNAAPPPQEDAWLPQDPPPWVLRLTGWLIIAFVAGAFLAAALIRLPETVRCRFRLVPSSGADPIQAHVEGRLERVAVTEGQEIEAGAPIVEIRSGEILTWQTELRSHLEDSRATQERVKRTEEAHRSLLQIKDAELAQFEQELAFRRKHVANTEDFVRRSRNLKKEGLISDVELLRADLEFANASKDANITEQGIQKVRLERAQLEIERSRQRSDEQATLEKLGNVIASLRTRLADCEAGVLTVRCPYRAIVVSVAQRNAGSMVHSGQEVCQLARVEDPPLAELDLAQAGLDRVVQGQAARLFFDTFPYERYGTLPARIGWVSPSAVVQGDRLQFRARAALERLDFNGKDRRIPVRAGMQGEARIRVGERTLLESVFEPLRALREQAR